MQRFVQSRPFTGARAQEMPKIEARYFDRQFRRIVFPKPESKGKNRSRVIYLPDEAFATVDFWAAKHTSGAVFRNTKGQPRNKNSVNNRFQRLKKGLGMPEVVRHRLASPLSTVILRLTFEVLHEWRKCSVSH